MEPMYRVWYYIEFQRQLAASKGSSRKPLVDVPADQQLNSLRAGQALVGLKNPVFTAGGRSRWIVFSTPFVCW
jgi:hypothetical protein